LRRRAAAIESPFSMPDSASEIERAPQKIPPEARPQAP
jgi:hypothetical protein